MATSIDVSPFQSAFGRLCDLSARALYDGLHPEMVREAFMGNGDAPELAAIRAQRVSVTRATARVKAGSSHAVTDVVREIIRTGRESRDAVQGEWMVTLPIVNPNP